ncbi:MAG: hypothetical protein GXP55_22025 [Deltaproteobacteria bacterium]|nr:hypothetical protein [Deltaproteobacteria bacterium]
MPLRRQIALFSLALALAPAGLAHAYELHTTADGVPTHWTQERVVFRLSPAARERLGAESLARAVGMATEAWRGLPGSPDLILGTGGGTDLVEPDAQDGVNGIYITDAPLDGDHLAETRLTFEPRSGRIVDVDVVISGVDPWALMNDRGGDDGAYDLGGVLTHEMGHALGLSDEPGVDEATMFPRFPLGSTRARTPEVDDERGVLAAYRNNPVKAAATGCSAGGDVSTGGALALALLMLAFVRRRGARRVPVRS